MYSFLKKLCPHPSREPLGSCYSEGVTYFLDKCSFCGKLVVSTKLGQPRKDTPCNCGYSGCGAEGEA